MTLRAGSFTGPLAAIWLIAVLGLMIGHRADIASGEFIGPDDDLRIVQVRDFIAGQGWFDTDQHRMNIPGTAPMHWSRLVDLPLAAVILATRPFLGEAGAEAAAGVAVPALTLLVLMAALFAVTRRLCGERLSVFALIAAVIWPSVYIQMGPMRIDHHGWQIALSAVTLLFLLDKRAWRGGLIAGAAGAAWAHISIEALPYLVGASAFLALRCLWDKDEGVRLAGFLTGLASASLLLFVGTKAPSAWGEAWCDAVMPGHIAAFILAALGTAPLAAASRMSPAWRAGTIALAGAASAAGFAAIAPQCLASPFSSLDPLVHELWYLNVLEGRPVWVEAKPSALIPLLPLALGALGTALGLLSAQNAEMRRRWLLMAAMLAAAVLIALFVRRALSVAAVYAVPGLTFLVRDLLVRVERRSTALGASPVSLAGGFAALFAAATSPVIPGMLATGVSTLMKAPPSASEASQERSAVCISSEGLSSLAALPPMDALAPIDIVPALLAHTPHRFVASGHHRNEAAMKDVMEAFLGTEDSAHALIERRGLDAVLFCDLLPETMLYATKAPDGFYAALSRGDVPAWLQQAPPAPGNPYLKVFLVRSTAAVDIEP
jgi:hypothetical protein